MNVLILDRLNEINQLQSNMELNELDYKAKSRKKSYFSKISLPIIFLRNKNTRYLWIEDFGK